VSRADDIIERALRAPACELSEVQREIVAFARDPAQTEEDRYRVLTVGELVAMTLGPAISRSNPARIRPTSQKLRFCEVRLAPRSA
jgi:hypothetical protein